MMLKSCDFLHELDIGTGRCEGLTGTRRDENPCAKSKAAEPQEILPPNVPSIETQLCVIRTFGLGAGRQQQHGEAQNK
jgi:hypothetical protein